MDYYVSEDFPSSSSVNGWAKISSAVEKDNPEKKLIWGYVSAAYIIALRLDEYRERFAEDNIAACYGSEIFPAMVRLCKKAVSLAMNLYFESGPVPGLRYASYSTGWQYIKEHLCTDVDENLDWLMEFFDIVNENDLVRDGRTYYVNFQNVIESTRRVVSLILTRAQ